MTVTLPEGDSTRVHDAQKSFILYNIYYEWHESKQSTVQREGKEMVHI